ncbi:conserved membrane hypothetical protein [Frankia sp. Hr75.2]|nr:conserved membrane hypothetical protein [Frankia sp. Hr75.2]
MPIMTADRDGGPLVSARGRLSGINAAESGSWKIMGEIVGTTVKQDHQDGVDEEDRGREGHGREERESAQERLNRNWAEILQELRVAQTGVQLLTAFLLALPFQNRFATLSNNQEWLYLAVVALSILATGLLITPVSLHRAMFRKREKETLVVVANRLAQAGLAVFSVAVSSVAVLIFDVTKNFTVGIIAGVLTLMLFATLWVAVPAALRPAPTPEH